MNSKLREKYGLKQLNIEIHKQLHEEIKAAAKRRNITVRKWVVRHIIRSLQNENP